MSIELSSSPQRAAFLDWIDERFPWKNALLFFILYLTTAIIARVSAPEVGLHLSMFDFAACFIAWSFFLVIRIFDEHKDYDKDLLNHPQRVLQSGRLTLSNLRTAAAIAIVSQFAASFALDGGFGTVSIAWIALFVWLCLMGKEFFCGEWLEKQLLLYAISHMAIMPFIVYWFAQLAAPGIAWNPALIALSALALLSGFAFEITRKTWGPEEERETIDSYARILGLKRAVSFIAFMVVGMTALQTFLIWQLTASVTATLIGGAILIVILLLALKTLLAFRRSPSAAGREKNEAAVGIATLVGYLTLSITLVVTQPLTFTLI